MNELVKEFYVAVEDCTVAFFRWRDNRDLENDNVLLREMLDARQRIFDLRGVNGPENT